MWYEETPGMAFPYADCRKLAQDNSSILLEDLIPELDLYMSIIAGYASWGERITSWSEGQISKAKEDLRLSFFEKYPKNSPLKDFISPVETPDLYRDLENYDSVRKKLLAVLSDLQPRDAQ